MKYKLLLVLFLFGCSATELQEPVYVDFNIESLPGLMQNADGYWELPLNPYGMQTFQRIQGRVLNTGLPRNSTLEPSEALDVSWESTHTWAIEDSLVYIVRRPCPTVQNATCVYKMGDGPAKDTIVIDFFEGQEVPTVNEHSYSAKDGEVNTMFAPIYAMLGDTVVITGIAYFPSGDSIVRYVNIILK